MTLDRGQSETIGAILLVAITVIAVSIVAGALFAASAPTSHPNARIDATANNSTVSIEHRAGEPIHEDEFEILLQETGARLAGVSGVPDEKISDNDSLFEPGEIWTFDAGYEISDGETVLLIYTNGDRVLLDETTVGFESITTESTPSQTTSTTTTTTSTTSTTTTTTSTTTTTTSTTTDTGTQECSIGSTNNPDTLEFTKFEKFQANKGADEWSISVGVQDRDGDNDLEQLKLEITDSEGTIRATETIALSGQQYQVQNLKIQPDDTSYDVPNGETYTITATVCDADGNSRSTESQTTS